VSVLEDVLREVRTGARPALAAARLGIDPGLAEAALDHWVRLGVVTPADALALGCSGCGTGEQAPSCPGCPTAGPVRLTLRPR
jgi:hypothetical protein